MSSIPLSDTQEQVERTIYDRILQECIDKGYTPDITDKLTYLSDKAMIVTFSVNFIAGNTIDMDVNGVSMVQVVFTTNHTITMGLLKTNIEAISGIEQVDATGKILTIIAESEDSPVTVTNDQVVGGISQPTISKALSDGVTGYAALVAEYISIKSSKGFAIEVFSHSPADKKDQKKAPRIVLVPGSFLPGALGGGQITQFELKENGNFTPYKLPPQTVDFFINIHLVSNSTRQARILHGIVALALPRRGYIPLRDDSTIKFHAENISYTPAEILVEGMKEDIYTYKISDIYDVAKIESSEVAKIEEITIETELTDDSKADDLVIT